MKKHILFVCTGNLCRSPLGEGILRNKLAERKIDSITVSSAGTFAMSGRPAAETAIAVAAERGVDISSHRTRPITKQILAESDLVLGMEMDHVVESNAVLPDKEGKYRLLSDFGPTAQRGHDIEDPYGASTDFFATIYEQIEECIEGLLAEHLL